MTFSPPVGKKGGGEECIDGQARAAGHEGGHGDRHEAVAAVLQGARGHDGRDVAAEADDERHEALARQPYPAHESVHDEGGARHVARIFEH